MDPQLAGTVVVNFHKPVPQEVLDLFQNRYRDLASQLPELKGVYVESLVTSKWYHEMGWIRCEPGDALQ